MMRHRPVVRWERRRRRRCRAAEDASGGEGGSVLLAMHMHVRRGGEAGAMVPTQQVAATVSEGRPVREVRGVEHREGHEYEAPRL